MLRYQISCADLAGCSWTLQAATLTEAAALVVRAVINPSVYGVQTSSDDAEYDGFHWHDGLTDDERDVLDTAHYGAALIRRAIAERDRATRIEAERDRMKLGAAVAQGLDGMRKAVA